LEQEAVRSESRGINCTRPLFFGLLAGGPVSIVHTETENEIRIISFRKATRREAQLFFDAIKD
jgi:uncharacterized DUF497 family protein